eukprot:8477082-Pyramimonas_sp.AAC.1
MQSGDVIKCDKMCSNVFECARGRGETSVTKERRGLPLRSDVTDAQGYKVDVKGYSADAKGYRVAS